MRFLGKTVRIKQCVKHVAERTERNNIIHLIFSPTLNGVRGAPFPTAQKAARKNFAAPLRASSKHYEVLTYFVLSRVKRRIVWKLLRDFINAQIAVGIVEPLQDGVIHSAIEERARLHAEVLRRDKKMRRDRGAEKGADKSFVLPAASGQGSSRFRGVSGRIARAIKNDRIRRRESGQEREDDGDYSP